VINRALIKPERSLNFCTPRTFFGAALRDPKSSTETRPAPAKQRAAPASRDRPRRRSRRGKDTDRVELSGFIQDLNVDERIDLVALTWFRRGEDDLESWHDLRAEALRTHNNRTAPYLLATPMLADYLEEALSQLGKSFEDFEERL
jgi:hypothetical protein